MQNGEHRPDLKRYRVLIAGERSQLLTDVGHRLREAGATVRYAHDAHTAGSLIRLTTPNAVVVPIFDEVFSEVAITARLCEVAVVTFYHPGFAATEAVDFRRVSNFALADASVSAIVQAVAVHARRPKANP